MRLPSSRRALAACALAAVAACGDDATGPNATDGFEPVGARDALTAAVVLDDPFDAFDAARWTARQHPLGRGDFWARNVVHDPAIGVLRLVHPAGTLDGGEIASVARYAFGRFEARLRTPRAPGTISALFLYEGGVRSDEIDIEIVNDGTRRVLFTTWIDERQTMSVTRTLPFDPADGFHDYRIEWERGVVRFAVDGVTMHEWASRKGVPTSRMHLFANSWWPVWIGGPAHATDHAMEIDRVVVTQ